MKLSTRARYALRFMIDIAMHYNDEKPLQLKDISERQGISSRYLGQIVISLKHRDLIRGIAGKNGGYVLAKPAASIRVADIIEAAIGPINVVDCVADPGSCNKNETCECRPIYALVNDRILDALNSFTLEELVKERKEKRGDDPDDCRVCSRRDLCSSAFRG